MIDFDFNGIRVVAATETNMFDYIDVRKGNSTRHEKDTIVAVHFWTFSINNGDLLGMAFVRSTLQYYMNRFWRHKPKKRIKIEFEKKLRRENELGLKQSLCFLSYLKENEHYLRVSVQSGGNTIGEVFMDGQEVLMLDIALGKAIGLLTPNSINRTL